MNTNTQPQLVLSAMKRLMREFDTNPEIDTRNGLQITRSDTFIFIDDEGNFVMEIHHICENTYGSLYDAGKEVFFKNFLPSWRFLKIVGDAAYVSIDGEYAIEEYVKIEGRYYPDLMG